MMFMLKQNKILHSSYSIQIHPTHAEFFFVYFWVQQVQSRNIDRTKKSTYRKSARDDLNIKKLLYFACSEGQGEIMTRLLAAEVLCEQKSGRSELIG